MSIHTKNDDSVVVCQEIVLKTIKMNLSTSWSSPFLPVGVAQLRNRCLFRGWTAVLVGRQERRAETPEALVDRHLVNRTNSITLVF